MVVQLLKYTQNPWINCIKLHELYLNLKNMPIWLVKKLKSSKHTNPGIAKNKRITPIDKILKTKHKTIPNVSTTMNKNHLFSLTCLYHQVTLPPPQLSSCKQKEPLPRWTSSSNAAVTMQSPKFTFLNVSQSPSSGFRFYLDLLSLPRLLIFQKSN
jgi:hypothetical protein